MLKAALMYSGRFSQKIDPQILWLNLDFGQVTANNKFTGKVATNLALQI